MMDMSMPATITAATGSTGTDAGRSSGASAGPNTGASVGSGDFLALLNALLPEVEVDAGNAEAAVTEALVELAHLGQRPANEPEAGAWPMSALLAKFIASPESEVATPPATVDEALPVTAEKAAPVPSQPLSDELATGELATGEQATGEQATGELETHELATGEQATGELATGELETGELAKDASAGTSVGSAKDAGTDGADPELHTAPAVEDGEPGAVLGRGTAADATVPAARDGSATADRAERPSPPGTSAPAAGQAATHGGTSSADAARAATHDDSSAANVSTDSAQDDPLPVRSDSRAGATLRLDTAEPTDGLRGVASSEAETTVRDATAARDTSARATSTQTSAASVQRVLDAVELLEKSPPPRYLTLELTDGRLRVSIEEGQVRLELLGERGEDASRLLEDAREALEDRGFDLDDDQGDDGDEHPAPSATGSPPARPRGPTGLRL